MRFTGLCAISLLLVLGACGLEPRTDGRGDRNTTAAKDKAPKAPPGQARKDRTPPSVSITAPQDGDTVSGLTTVSGVASDDSGLQRVELAVDSGVWVQAAGTSNWSVELDTAALADGAHVLHVRATDLAGLTTEASCGITVQNGAAPPPPAPLPPTVAIGSPSGGDTVQGVIQVTGTASDDDAVTRVELQLDGGAYLLASGTTSWSLALDTTALQDGSHSLTARAIDSDGLQASTSVTINVQNDTTAPPAGLGVSIASPAGGQTLSGVVTVQGSLSSATRLQVRMDSMAYIDIPVQSSWSYSFDSAVLANGAHTLRVVASDMWGAEASQQIGFSSSNLNTAPQLSFAAPADGATVSGLVQVVGLATDPHGVGQAQIAVDGGPYQYATGFGRFERELDTSTLENGSHTLWARVTDGLGASTTRSITIKVANSETVPPSVSIDWPTAGAKVSGTIVVSGSAADNVALQRVELKESYGAYEVAQGTSSWSYAIDTRGLSNGSHTLLARAVDTTGHATTSSVTVTVDNGYSKETLTTPEGARIEVDSAAGWSADAIYRMLKENARDLDLIGPSLTVRVDDLSGANAQTSCSSTSCSALIHLGSGSFTIDPQRVLAHEYGHVWTLRALNLLHGRDWWSYLQFRGLHQDPRINSNYPSWDISEIIADDYRELFGSAAARGFSHPVAHPVTVTGLASFLTQNWAGGL